MNFFLGLECEYIVFVVESSGTRQEIFQTVKTQGENYILDKDTFRFTEHYYNELIQYLRQVNWFKPDYDFTHGGTKKAKKYILNERYKKRKHVDGRKDDEVTVDLSSIVSSLIARGQPYKDIFDYPIYVIYNLYHRLSKVDEYKNTMQALYSGCIDTKKNPINWNKINWSSIIE